MCVKNKCEGRSSYNNEHGCENDHAVLMLLKNCHEIEILSVAEKVKIIKPTKSNKF